MIRTDRLTAMSGYSFELPALPPGPQQADDSQPTSETRLHAQKNDRVYQAAGNQYILSPPLPTPAAAANTLPRDTTAFTGRGEEVSNLTDLVTRLVATSESIPIFSINGMPGVGKTTLAVHVAHKLAPVFPDGRMFVDMHSHTDGKTPVDPAEALFALLSVDGVNASDIPDDLDGRSALWRARIAGRRSILVLDNVASHQQVAPLLPGAAGSLVLVTSRRRLTGLAARHAAIAVPLGPLPPSAAAELFDRLAGRHLGGEQDTAVAELVKLCGCLPLAISLLAARLRPEPQWRVQALVDELTAAQDRLVHMRAEDIEVAAAFDLSYRNQPAVRRRLFRRLGLHPGIDIDAYAAAALCGVGLASASQHLEALYDDHLVDQPVRGRYRFHDLLGAYARAHATREDARQRDLAVSRLMDYYYHAAKTADRHIAPRPHPAAALPSKYSGPAPDLADAAKAAAWMASELPNLLACAGYLLSHGDGARLISMSAALAAFLRRAGPYRQAVALHRAAAAAASRQRDLASRAAALANVGILLRRAADYATAIEVLAEARKLYQDLDDRIGQADVLTATGIVHRLAGDHTVAADMLTAALGQFRDLADLAGQAEVLVELAVIQRHADNYTSAVQLLDQALDLYRRTGRRQGQAYTLLQLGTVRRLTGDLGTATQAFQDSR